MNLFVGKYRGFWVSTLRDRHGKVRWESRRPLEDFTDTIDAARGSIEAIKATFHVPADFAPRVNFQ